MNTFRSCVVGILTFGCVFLAGCVSVPHATTQRESLKEICRQSGAQMSFDPVTLSIKVVKGREKIHLLVGSDVATVGQDRVLMNAPVVMERGEAYVPDDFRSKVFCRLDRTACLSRVRRGALRIVIDPGHGGKDPGALGYHGLKEKDVVLDVAKRLERLLERSGYNVRLTRSSDVFISLEERTRRATEWNADIFISIHANASKSHNVNGFEVWATRPLTYEDLSESQRQRNDSIFFNHLNMLQHHHDLEKTLEDMCYRYKYFQSQKLAEAVSQSCSGSRRNRGVKQSGFFVLRNTLVPAILVEVGFVTNSREAGRLKASSHRQTIAEEIAEGIKDYARRL